MRLSKPNKDFSNQALEAIHVWTIWGGGGEQKMYWMVHVPTANEKIQ